MTAGVVLSRKSDKESPEAAWESTSFFLSFLFFLRTDGRFRVSPVDCSSGSGMPSLRFFSSAISIFSCVRVKRSLTRKRYGV